VKKIIFVFDEYDKAKIFAKAHHMVLHEDIYPIAKIDNKSVASSLKNIIDIALSHGINHMEYNSMAEDVFGFHLAWLLQANSLKHETVLIEGTTEKLEEVNEEKNITINFYPMKILNLYNPYEIDGVRKKFLALYLMREIRWENTKKHFIIYLLLNVCYYLIMLLQSLFHQLLVRIKCKMYSILN